MKDVEYPLEVLPGIDRAGTFPLLNSVYGFAYQSPTHALHLYGYSGRIWIGRNRFDFNEGDLTVTPKGEVSRYACEHPGKHIAVHFTYPEKATQRARFQVPCFVPISKENLLVREQLSLIVRLYHAATAHDGTPTKEREAAARLHALLLSLVNLSRTDQRDRRSRSNFEWDQLFKLVEDRLAEPICTNDLASKLNISPHTLAVRFRNRFGCTVSQYILRKRIDHAKVLLVSTAMTVNEVGTAVGIGDPQYFNKQFRRVAGISPSRYRDESREQMKLPPDWATRDGYWAE